MWERLKTVIAEHDDSKTNVTRMPYYYVFEWKFFTISRFRINSDNSSSKFSLWQYTVVKLILLHITWILLLCNYIAW